MLKRVIYITLVKAVALLLIFNLACAVFLFSKVSFRGLLMIQPVVASLAMVFTTPFDKKLKAIGSKYYAFLLVWMVLSVAVLIAPAYVWSIHFRNMVSADSCENFPDGKIPKECGGP